MRRKIWLLLLIAGLGVVARPAGRHLRRSWYGWRASATWDRVRSVPFSGGVGDPYGWLSVPKAGISQLVRNGPDEQVLIHSPCAETIGTSILIMAHRDTHFRRLGLIEQEDLIELEQRCSKRRIYRCLETLVIERDEVGTYLQSLRDDRLLLMTCYPFRFIGPAPQRYLVICERMDP